MKQVGVQTNPSTGVGGSVGASTVIAPTPPAPPSNPSAIVSGAGTVAANGTYTYRGESLGFPYYNLIGQPDDLQHGAISRPGDQFSIYDIDGTFLYTQITGAALPWLDTYDVVDGTPPAPTVTQG